MENYVLYDEIGRGENTVVYKGRRKGTINFVAIYCIEKILRAEITNRVRLTHELCHENIVGFNEWYETSNHLWIVVELCTGGTLRQVIEQDKNLPEVCIRKFGRCILRGLYYIHSIGIVFCNLTSNKVLLDGEGNLKLSDFTLSRVPGEDLVTIFQQTMEDFEEGGEINTSRLSLEKAYCAPEVLKFNTFTPLSDLWSFGCILYEMFVGEPPFNSANDELLSQVETASFPSPRGKVLSAQHTEKPSKEFLHLINGLLNPEPSRRLDWATVADHPFWKGHILTDTMDRPVTLVTAGETSELDDGIDTLNASTCKLAQSLRMTQELRSSLRPKTGEDPKLAHMTQGNSNAVAAPDDEKLKPMKDVTSARKKEKVDTNEGKKAATLSRNNTQGSFKDARNDNFILCEWKQLIYTSSDLSTGAIMDNPKISKVVENKFDAKQLPVAALSVEAIKKFTEDQMKSHFKPFADALAPSEKNNSLQKAKLNICAYLMKVASDSVCNILINHFRILNIIVNHVKTNSLPEMRVKYCRLIGVMAQNCDRVNHGTNLMEVIVVLTEVLRDSFRNVKVKQTVLPAIGEVLFLIASQEEKEGSSIDSWTIPSISFTMVTRCLREGEESVTQHYAAKIIENIAATTGVHSNKFSTTEVALLLWNLFSHCSSDALKVVAISALSRINKLNASIFPSVIDKVGLPNVLDSMAANSKIQQSVLTMFLTMLSCGQHLTRVSQDRDFVTRIMKLLESPIATVRAKTFLLLLVIAENNTEMLVFMCSTQRLIVYIERDTKKQTSARPETCNSTQYLSQCLEQLVQSVVSIFPIVIQDVVATLDSVSGRKHPSTLQLKQIKTTIPLFAMSTYLISSQIFRNRILDTDIVSKFGQLLSHVRTIDSGETCIDSPNSSALSEEFKKTCLGVIESLVQHPQIIITYNLEIVDGVMPPLSHLLIHSDNTDIRLVSQVLLSEITSEVLNHCLSNQDPKCLELKTKVMENFQQILLPNFEQILIYQDPIPAYGLKMLTNLLEAFPSCIKDVEEGGVIPIMFQVMGEHESDLTGTVIVSLVNIFNTIVTTKGANLDLLYDQGLADVLCNLFLSASESLNVPEGAQNTAIPAGAYSEKDVKAIHVLTNSILETLQNLLKYASNIVRVTLQQKNNNGQSTDTSRAEALLLRNKVFMQLMSALIQMLTCSDADIQEVSCNILFILVQLYGGASDDVTITSSQNLNHMKVALIEFDTKKQRVLLRFFKRVLSSDEKHVTQFKESSMYSDMVTLIQKLATSTGAQGADISVSSVAKEVLKILN